MYEGRRWHERRLDRDEVGWLACRFVGIREKGIKFPDGASRRSPFMTMTMTKRPRHNLGNRK